MLGLREMPACRTVDVLACDFYTILNAGEVWYLTLTPVYWLILVSCCSARNRACSLSQFFLAIALASFFTSEGNYPAVYI